MFCTHKTVGSNPIRSKFEVIEHGVIGNVPVLGTGVMGSSPIVLTEKNCPPRPPLCYAFKVFCIAQSVEQRAFNSEVLGSNPSVCSLLY